MAKERKTVLSIDGGGIRGIIPAMILAEIEERTLNKIRESINDDKRKEDKKLCLHAKVDGMVKTKGDKEFIPTAKLFNVVTGVSTGGILALGLTVPDPNATNQPKYTAAELVDLYRRDGKEIFHRSFWHRIPGIRSVVGFVARGLKVKYSSKGIRGVLKNRFKGARLKDALVSVLVLSYEMVDRRPWFFRSIRAAAEETQSTYDFPMTDVALATSAAPTYFSPHQMSATDNDGIRYIGKFIDGGIYANHPAMCAFVEARDMGGKDILLVSLGTGERTPFFKSGRGSGVFFWARRIFNVILDGASDTVAYQLGRLIPDSNGFYRFQPTLSGKNIGLDDVQALPKLEATTNQFIEREDNRLNRLCCRLAKRFLQQLENEDS